MTDFTRDRDDQHGPLPVGFTTHSFDDTIAPVYLDQVTRREIDRWVAALLAQGVSHRNVSASKRVLSAILTHAVDCDLIPVNPAKSVRLPAAPPDADKSARRILTAAQLEQLYAHGPADPGPNDSPAKRAVLEVHALRVRSMLRVLGDAALRRDEVCGLRWEDVDLATGTITVRFSGDRIVKGKRVLPVGVSSKTREVLADWSEQSRLLGHAENGYVWPGRDGASRMNPHSVGQAVARALRKAGLVDDLGKPLVTAHGLRHTRASLFLAAGEPVVYVSAHLRHANPNITNAIYAHVIPNVHRESILARLEAEAPSAGR